MRTLPLIRFLVLVLLAALPMSVRAHIGSPTVFFDGAAGPHPVHIVVHPPGVIPGLAEITVRLETNTGQRVTVLPIRWNTGREGAPRPDEAMPVRGDSNLFSASLWFMASGAQSVEVEVSGSAGKGRVIVPVNAVATRVLGMPRGLTIGLGIMGTLLVLMAASIAGGAVRDSVLPAGEVASGARRGAARMVTGAALAGIVAILWFGKGWWDKEARDYMNNRLFRPVNVTAEVLTRDESEVLRLSYAIDLLRRNGPLVPDHGKLMHLFLIREPGLDAFAHLHPLKENWQTFETLLPELPAGDYRLYGDVTYETGLADTLTARVTLPDVRTTGDARKGQDADDSWRIAEPISAGATGGAVLSPDYSMSRIDGESLVESRDIRLRFSVRDKEGQPVKLEDYMGMRGHLILRSTDGSVFTHLHPSGSFSMAAKQLFDMRVEGTAPLTVAGFTNEPFCRLPLVFASQTGGAQNELSFPYAFPKAGTYRLWVQSRIAGKVLTGVFDVAVSPAR